jgi:PadR family transcriptional regulator, regulatory protein AphA
MSPRRRTDLTIEHALLGWLQREPLHGYELHLRMEDAQALGLVWRLKQAHLYALLSKLEEAGYIVSEETDDARAGGRGRMRRPMRLTREGRRAFATWMSTPVTHGRDLRLEFLAKLYWAQQQGRETAERLIAAQRAACRAWLAALDDELRRTPANQPYARLVIEFRHSQIEASIGWLDTCRATLAAHGYSPDALALS